MPIIDLGHGLIKKQRAEAKIRQMESVIKASHNVPLAGEGKAKKAAKEGRDNCNENL
jgi:hypothetical protein